MKLRNKKTGEIVEVITGDTFEKGGIQIRSLKRNPQIVRYYASLAELNEEWEDVLEEPKEDGLDNIIALVEAYNNNDSERYPKEIVEKLKAWKRLKDKGFRFNCWYGGSKDMSFSIPQEIIDRATAKDLDLLFGGEE